LWTRVTQNGPPGTVNVPGYDINLFHSSSAPIVNAANGSGASVIGRVVDGVSYVDKLAPGTIVGPGSAYLASSPASLIVGNPPPTSPPTSWQGVLDTGFLGIRFEENSSTYYGWVRVLITPGQGKYDVTLLDWGYEDTGAPIAAAAIPEPGTACLGMLALGTLGRCMLSRRVRRRRAC
jgi:hypothetical protein